jgi:hypothetical protein
VKGFQGAPSRHATGSSVRTDEGSRAAQQNLVLSNNSKRNAPEGAAVSPVDRRGGKVRAYRMAVCVSCTGIIRCSLGLPGNMTKGCVGSFTSASRG